MANNNLLQPVDLEAAAQNAVASFRANYGKQAAAPPAPAEVPERGVLNDIGTGLKANVMVDMPKMAGQVGQALGLGGNDMVKAATARGELPEYQTTGIAGAGARGVPTALAAMGLGALAATGVPEGAAAILAAGAPAAALFGLSSYQDTKQKALDAGATPQDAEDAGRKAGAIMGIGQAAAGAVGARVMAGSGGALASAVMRKGALENGLQSFVNPGLMKVFGKDFAEMMGVQLPVQAASAAAMNEVETGAGIKTGKTNAESAYESLGPTAVMTALLAPAGMFGAKLTVNHRRLMAETVSGSRYTEDEIRTPENTALREKQLQEMSRQLRRVAPREKVEEWQNEASRAIADGLPVELTDGFTYEGAKQAKAARDAEARAAGDAATFAAMQPGDQGELDLGAPGGQQFALEPSGEERVRPDQSTQMDLPLDHAPAGQGELDFGAPERERAARSEKAANYDKAGQGQLDLRENLDLAPPPGTAPSVARTPELRRQGALDLNQPFDLTSPPGKVAPRVTPEENLKNELPKVPTSVRDRLADAKGDPVKEAKIAREILAEKEGGKQAYLVMLDEFASKREKENESRTNTETAPAADQGAKPERAAGAAKPEDTARTEQVASAQGNAEAGRTSATDEKAGGNGQAKVTSVGVTREALDLLDSVRDGGTPAFMTNNLKRIAKENGIEVSGSDTPNSVVEKIRAKAAAGRAERDKTEAQSTVDKATSGITPDLTERERQDLPSFKQNEERRKAAGQAPGGVERRAPAPKTAVADALAAPANEAVWPSALNNLRGYGVEGRVEPGKDVSYAVQTSSKGKQPVREEASGGQGQAGGQAGVSVQPRRTEADVKARNAVREKDASKVAAKLVEQESKRPGQEAIVKAIETKLDANMMEQHRVNDDLQRASLELKNPNPRKQYVKQIGRLQARGAELQAEHDRLMQMHSDAIGTAEKLANPEPSANRSYLDPTRKAYGQIELSQLATDMKLTGKLPEGVTADHIDTTLKGRAGDDMQSKKAQKAAEKAMDAFDALPKEQRDHLVYRLKQRAAAVDFYEKIADIARTKEDNIRRSLTEQAMDEHEFSERLDINDRNLAKGLITPEQHEKNILQTLADAMERGVASEPKQERVDAIVGNRAARRDAKVDAQIAAKVEELYKKMYRRGIAGLDDPALHGVNAVATSVHDLVNHIAQNHASPLMRAVATALSKFAPNAQVHVVENADFNGARYNQRTHTIEVGRGGMNSITIMHETVHSLAHAAINRAMANAGRTDLSPQEHREVAALNTVRDVMAKFAKVADPNNEAHRYALEDEHEFLSEAMSNPDIRAVLDRKGWWAGMVDKIRGLLNMDAKYKTDFQRLLEASPDLFGAPDQTVDRVYNDRLAATAKDENGNYRNTPRGWFGRITGAHDQMGTLSDARKWDVKGALMRGMLRWTSYNNGIQWLERRAQRLIVEHPEHAGKINAFVEAFRAPKSVIEHRNALNQHLLNAPQESSDVTRAMARAAREDPANFKAMAEMARRGRQAGVDPRDATLASARRRNAGVTQEMFDSALARRNRSEWQRLKDTASGKVYERVRQHNELSFARHYATMLNEIRHAFNIGRDNNLDWWTHTKDANGFSQRDPQVQLDKLNAAITASRLEAKQKVDYTKAMAGAKKGDVPDLKDNYRETVESLLTEYDRQRAQPYVHFGRMGDHYIHFTVRKEHYAEVQKIVSGDEMKAGGLGRDMGPDTGTRVVNMAFDNRMQHEYAMKLLKPLADAGKFNDDEGKSTWSAGKTVERYSKTDGATPLFIRKLQDRIRESADIPEDMKDRMVREITDAHIASMPDSNPMTATMQADLANGSSTDFVNTFARRQTMANTGLVSAYSNARLGDAMATLSSAMKAIKGEPALGPVANELANYEGEVKGRISDMQVPVRTPGFDWLRSLAAPFRLALSPAYVAMVAYQPLQMTLPVLGANHGWSAAAGAMARNYGTTFSVLNHMFKTAWDINKGTNLWERMSESANPTVQFDMKNKDGSSALHPAVRELLDRLQWSGLINFGQMQQIWRPFDASEAAVRGVSQTTNKVADANRIASALPHYVEMSNRIVAALTAHELALTKGAKNKAERDAMMKNATPEQREKAAAYAMQVIRNTDGDHSQGNIARALGRRGFLRGATPLVVGFNQYDFQMTESLVRLALNAVSGDTKKGDTSKGEMGGSERSRAQAAIAGVFAMTGVMAGTLGLPFMGMFSALYNRIGSTAQALGGNQQDTPPDFEKGMRDFINATFGEKAGEIVARGVPRLLDVDMSNRSGYQDLAPFTDALKDRQNISDTFKDQALNFAGPAVGIWVGMANAAEALYKHNYPTAINQGLPAFMRNAAKAWRMSQYGYEREGDANAQIPIDVSTWNIVAQAAGFTGGRKTDVSEKQFQWDTNQKILHDRLAMARDNWLRAMDHGDGEAVGDAMQSIIKFATAQPQFAHAPGQLASDYMQRMQGQGLAAAMGGVHVPKSQIAYYNQFANGGGPQFPQ